MFNATFIEEILYKYSNLKFDISMAAVITTMLTLYLLNYLLFISNKIYVKIECYFDNEKNNNKIKNNIYFYLYLTITFLSFGSMIIGVW